MAETKRETVERWDREDDERRASDRVSNRMARFVEWEVRYPKNRRNPPVGWIVQENGCHLWTARISARVYESSAGWCIQWRSDRMPAPAFWYSDTEQEARESAAILQGTRAPIYARNPNA